MLAGAGTTAALLLLPMPRPSTDDSPAVVAFQDGLAATGTGNARIPVPDAASDRTTLRLTFDCLTSGMFLWGAAPQTRSLTVCSGTDAAAAGSARTVEVPAGAARALTIETSGRSGWSIVARLVGEEPGPSGVNLKGQTYGDADDVGGPPDLVSAVGLDQEGRQVHGFVFRADLEGEAATTVEEVVTRRDQDRARFPDGRPLPLYEADGETRVGTFTVGVG